MQDYRQIIRAELARRQRTQSHLARVSGVQRIVLARWLRGEKAITDATLGKLAAALSLELRRK